jgi:hypothetical protein
MYAETRMQPARRPPDLATLAALLSWALVLAPGDVVAAEPRAGTGVAAAESTPSATPAAVTTGSSRRPDATAGPQSVTSLPDRTVSLATAVPVTDFSAVPGLCPVITDVLFETCRSHPQEAFCQP